MSLQLNSLIMSDKQAGMEVIMKKCIYKGTLKSVYVDKDKAEKVFALSYSKSDVLYEGEPFVALTTYVLIVSNVAGFV